MTDATERVLTISVVIPAYNQRRYIEDAIRSVLTQDWPVQEIIVVDDGSTDADYGELETLYERVRVIRTENGGVSRARNLGAAEASANVVAFLDADDVWLPCMLRRQMSYLEQNNSVAAVFCKAVRWFPTRGKNGRETWHIPDALKSQENETYRVHRVPYIEILSAPQLPGHICVLLIRKAAFTSLGGFDEQRRYGEDIELVMRISRSSRLDVLEFPGMLYRQHSESATGKLQEANHMAELILDAVQRYGLEGGDGAVANKLAVDRRLASVHLAHGRRHFFSGSLGAARIQFWQSCKYRCEIKTVAYLIAAVTPGGSSLAGFLRKMIRG